MQDAADACLSSLLLLFFPLRYTLRARLTSSAALFPSLPFHSHYGTQVYEQMIQQIEDDTGTLPASLPRGVPPEIAASNADVQAIIQPRLTMLMEIANTFLGTIIESMETVPYGIRWICKQIRSLTRVSGCGCSAPPGGFPRRGGGGRRKGAGVFCGPAGKKGLLRSAAGRGSAKGGGGERRGQRQRIGGGEGQERRQAESRLWLRLRPLQPSCPASLCEYPADDSENTRKRPTHPYVHSLADSSFCDSSIQLS